MNTTELYRIIEQKERNINSLEQQNKELIVKYMDIQEQLTIPIVTKQSELLVFKEWFNELPEESDDRLYITDETIDRFKANCG